MSDESNDVNQKDTESNSEQKTESGIDGALKNLKSEFSRKIENLSTTITSQNQQMEALIAKLNSNNSASNTKTETVDLGELIYQNPNEAVNKITERVVDNVNKRTQQEINTRNTVTRLQNEYPELLDASSTAYKSAEKYYDSLPTNLRGTPEGAEIALMRAVKEEGLVPKNKRNSDSNEDFSMDGSGARRVNSKRGKPDTEIAPETLGFAQLMGKNIKDPKYLERIKKESKRNFNKWSSVEDKE